MGGYRLSLVLACLALGCSSQEAGGPSGAGGQGGGAGGEGGGGSGGGGGAAGPACPEDQLLKFFVEGPTSHYGYTFEMDGVVDELRSLGEGTAGGMNQMIVVRASDDAFVRIRYQDPESSIAPPVVLGDQASVALFMGVDRIDGGDFFAIRLRNSANGAEWEFLGFVVLAEEKSDWEIRNIFDKRKTPLFLVGETLVCPGVDGDSSDGRLYSLAFRWPDGTLQELDPWVTTGFQLEDEVLHVLTPGVLEEAGPSGPLLRAHILYSRIPAEPPLPCDADRPCPDHQYCDLAEDVCGGPGRCRPRPQDCVRPMVPQRVCACDGVVYDSVCSANLAGTDVSFRERACPAEVFTCGPMVCRVEEPCYRSLEKQRIIDHCLYWESTARGCEGLAWNYPDCSCEVDTPVPGAITVTCPEPY